jgi:hypothetical protein
LLWVMRAHYADEMFGVNACLRNWYLTLMTSLYGTGPGTNGIRHSGSADVFHLGTHGVAGLDDSERLHCASGMLLLTSPCVSRLWISG